MADLTNSILIKVLDAFTGPLRDLEHKIVDVGQAADRIKKKFAFAADLNQAAESAGRFGDMIRAPIEGAINEFRGFEKQMSEVAALSGEIGTEGFQKLKEQALELGAATSYSAEEAAQAQAQYAQAGRSVNEILAVTPLTLAAAKANGMGLAETAAIIGHTMSGMGIATSDTARVVDVLTAASAASDLKLSDMGQALAYVGPVARQSGMSLELTAAFIGKLKDAGLEASAAGTGLRATISRLLDPSKEAAGAFAKLGINSKALKELQQSVATGHLDDALRKIGAASEKLPNEARMQLMSQIFGLEASTAANVAISASMDTSDKGLEHLNASLHKVDGATARLATVMGDNLDGALERAGGAVSGLQTAVGEVLKPTVEAGAASVEKLAGRMQKWVGENPKAAKATLELVAGLGALSFGLKGILITASTLTSASAAIQTAFMALSSSMVGQAGLVLAAGAAGYAIGSWANETFDLTEKINAALGRAKPEEARAGGEVQMLAGGYSTSKTTGEVITLGKGEGPRAVREARAAGATTLEEINAHIRMTRAQQGAKPFSVAPTAAAPKAPGTMLEQYASEQARQTSPLMAEGGSVMAAYAAATQTQTDALLETLYKQEKNTSELVALMKRGGPTRTPNALAGP